jgi:signal transduction histidine kinase
VGILDLGISFQSDRHKFIAPTTGNFPMRTSDRELDANQNIPSAQPLLQYPTISTELSIDGSIVMPIFTEATTMAIRLTEAPVAILMVTGISGCQIGAIAGLEQFTQLPTDPDLLLELAGLEYCYAQIMSGESNFSVTNCQQHPQLSQLALCQVHGIQSYLGVPMITAAKDRLGTIAILDFKPCQSIERDLDLLQLISRLVTSEIERKLLSQAQLDRSIGDLGDRSRLGFDDQIAATEYVEIERYTAVIDPKSQSSQILPNEDLRPVYPQVQSETQFKLLTHLAQEFRTPLTAILGMASVLQQEIYGSLNGKQKDYLGIIHCSGQQLVSIVDEIAQLSGLDCHQQQLTLSSVNLELLCQLVIQSLASRAKQKNHQIVLNFGNSSSSLEPRIWLLDKDKVRQILYYLGLSLIHASADLEESATSQQHQISIQISAFNDELQIQLLADDPQVILPAADLDHDLGLLVSPSVYPDYDQITAPNITQDIRISLGLLLSHTLAAAHDGKIEIVANGGGYQLSLPLILIN